MINNSNEFNRRILNFPAIRPCESVSFSSLLNSLINLSRSICRLKSSKTFFTNKENARNSIRLIETLVVFLEELRCGRRIAEDSSSTVVLCLSELHFIFQKLRFLLEDCARADVRLRMLVKSEEASTHFRVLFNAVAAALDVLPLSEIAAAGVDVEVLELVEFVRRQAVKSKFEVERDDRRAMRKVFRVLDQFESGSVPESMDLKRVLRHLKIESWSECNDEIKCLESEIRKECGGFLSSLVGFMIYCRCTLFPTVSDEKARVSNETSGWVIGHLNPDDFRCPITLEIMCDPVTLSTGHTYDRSSILKWFRSGNHTCPKTGEKLICVDLVQNLALKRLITQYCIENMIKHDESSGRSRESRSSATDVHSASAEQAMALLANYLVSRIVAGTDEEQNKAAFEIRLLTKTSNFNRSRFVEADAILPLLDLLYRADPDPAMQDNAIAALLNLSKYPRSRKIIVENGGLEAIVKILTNGLSMEARQHAAGALFYLASVEDNRRLIGRIPGAISGLMGVLNNGADRGKKNSLAAILGLLMYPENHWRFLQGGLVQLLANLLIRSSENEDLTADLLAVLATLAVKVDGAVAIISAGILPITMQILSSSNSRAAKEYCVSLMLSLSINDAADVIPILVKNPSIMVSLYSLIADGSARSSKKAASLIKILHSFNEKSSSSASLAQEQFVRVW